MTCGADFQHSLPPDDKLTGGASLRDYFAAQALRSHYIISRTSGSPLLKWVARDSTVQQLGALCYEIADAMMEARKCP